MEPECFVDIHKEKAAEMFGIPIEQVTEEQRQSAKKMNYWPMYSGDFLVGEKNLAIINKMLAPPTLTSNIKELLQIKKSLPAQKFGRVKP